MKLNTSIVTVCFLLLSCLSIRAQPVEVEVDSFYLDAEIKNGILPFFRGSIYKIPWQENGEYLLLLENKENEGVANATLIVFRGSIDDARLIQKGLADLKGVDFSKGKYVPERKIFMIPIVTHVGDSEEFGASEEFEKFISLQESLYGTEKFRWPVLKSYYYNPLIHR
jgi:hypothetical protein